MTESSKPVSKRLKAPAIAAGAALLAFAVGFGIAHFRGQKAVAECEDVRTNQLEQARQAQSEAQAEVDRYKSRSKILAAAGSLQRAARSLEERNFGTSESRVQQARRLLVEAEAADAQAVGEVAGRLGDWQPEVTEDVGAQRKRLFEMADELTRAVEN